jgi:hypothetical protein
MIDTVQTVEFQGITYNAQHGSPFDRGSADSYYGRPQSPHKYPNGTGNAPRVEGPDMTLAEMREYYRGYEYNQESGERKQYD